MEAERLVRRGQLQAAERVYRKLFAHNPSHVSVLTGLGRILLRERRFEEAIEIWGRVVELEKHHPSHTFQLARSLHRSGRFEDAAAQYMRVVALDPLHEKAYSALEQLTDRLLQSGYAGTGVVDMAACLAEQVLAIAGTSSRARLSARGLIAAARAKTEPQAAIDHWQEMATLNPDAIAPRLHLARAWQDRGDHEQARTWFASTLERDPQNTDALLGYGQALEVADRIAAIRHFVAWSTRQPAAPAPRLELARLYLKSDDWEQAAETFRGIIAHAPPNPKTLARFAQILSRNLTRIEPALNVWQRLAELDPSSPFPLVQRAQLLERAKRPDDAEREYRSALQRSAQDVSALFGLARLLLARGDWSDARRLYLTLHQLDPRRVDVLLGLGRCLERLDQAEEALETYEKVLNLAPGNLNGLQYRGRLLRQIGRLEEAIQTWQKACDADPHNADSWYELVFMLATAERDVEALDALDRAEATLPATPASWAKLGLAAQAGQFDERAVHYFERAAKAEPTDSAHHARLGQHYLRRGILDGAFHHLLASRELKPNDLPVARQLVASTQALKILGIDAVALAAAPHRCGDLLVPEALFSLVRQRADSQVQPYTAVPRRVIAVTSSLAGGGAERQLVNLMRGLSAPAYGLDLALFAVSLSRRGRRDFFLPLLQDTPVEIVTPDEGANDLYLSAAEVVPYRDLIKAFPADMVVPIAFWLAEFRRRRPEVVHAWQDATNLTAVVAALLAGVPRIILGTRSVRPDNPRRRLKRYMQHGYRAVLGHPAVILSNNSRTGAADYADWLQIDPTSVDVVYNGIDFDDLAQRVDPARVRSVRERLGIPDDAPLIGSVFRMSEEKRPLFWVETAAQIAQQERRAHFVVYGEGPMRSDMLQLADELGIAHRFHLPGPEKDIASCYKAMDVVLLASRHEGLPNVLLEAQSLGIPVVAPDVGGIGEAVWSGVTGWVVPNADATRLAQRVLVCLNDRSWATKAAAEGPSFVRERFGIEPMVQRTLEVYGIGDVR